MCDIGAPELQHGPSCLCTGKPHTLAALRTSNLTVTVPVRWAVKDPLAFTEKAELHKPEEPTLAIFELAQIKVQ